jgi:hypothetical protein
MKRDPSLFELLDQVFLLENEVDHLQEKVARLEEYIAVLEGDLKDIQMVFISPWWKGGVL